METLGKGVVEIRSTVDSGNLGAVNMESHSSVVGLSILNTDGDAAESGYAITVGTFETPATGVLIKHSTARSNNGSAVGVLQCSSLTVKGSTLDGAFDALFTESGDCDGDGEYHADVYVLNSWLIGVGPVVFLAADTWARFANNAWSSLDGLISEDDGGTSDPIEQAVCTGNYYHESLNPTFEGFGSCDQPVVD